MLHKKLLWIPLAMLLLGALVSSSLLFATPVFASGSTGPEPSASPTPVFASGSTGPEPSASPTPVSLRLGSTGPAVTAWERQLDQINSQDCDPYINLGPAVQWDGKFSVSVAKATISFQEAIIKLPEATIKSLHIIPGLTANGIVDSATLADMAILLNEQMC